MAETQDQINQSLFEIMRLSPTAKHSVEEQKYNMSFQVEEVDLEAIRQEAFVGLVEDMSSVGIYFAVPNEDIYSDHAETLSATLRVLEFLLPSTLYVKLRRFPKLVDGIKGILRGVSDEPILQSYLEYLGGSDQAGGLFPAMFDDVQLLSDKLRCEGIFYDYFENMITLIEEERVVQVSPPVDVNAWQRFRTAVELNSAAGLQGLAKALDPTDENKQMIDVLYKRLQVSLIQPFASPLEQARLSFLYLTDPATLSSNMQRFYNKVVLGWKVTSKVFPQYFTERKQPIASIDALGFVLYAFSTTETSAQFERAISILAKDVPLLAEVITAAGAKLTPLKEQMSTAQ